MIKLVLISLSFLLPFTALAQIVVNKDIFYSKKDKASYSLNIYQPKKSQKLNDVLVFVHGGSWSSGDKKTYWWLGRNFARKGVICVVINYPLAPAVKYNQMALAVAEAFLWTKGNIAEYGGNPDRIFAMGHSAGAHLIELINADGQYFKNLDAQNPIKGVVLNDPFGLDMHEYLSTAEKDHFYYDFIRTFTLDPAVWKKGSPLSYVTNIKNPHLLFYGSKTYGAIKLQTPQLFQALATQNVSVQLNRIKGKKHVGMIAQMIFGHNKLYQLILDFMKTVS